MRTFKYNVRDKTGRLITGIMESVSVNTAADKLKLSGFTPVTIKEKRQLPLFLTQAFSKTKVERRKINVFTRQLATLQKAGVSIISGLEATAEQTESKPLKKAIKNMLEKVKAGESLSLAMSFHKNIFNDLYISMVKVAETGGVLPETLERLANLQEHEEDTRSRIKSATRYPLIVLIALVAAFTTLITLVVPRFLNIYQRFDTQLPLPTRILIGINFIISNYWWAIVIFVIAVAILVKKFIDTKKGRLLLDKTKLKIPIFGELIVFITMSRFARILSILTKSGVPILQTLDSISKGIGNATMARVIDGIKTGVSHGKGLSAPMKLSKFFPPMVIQMVAVGEETGNLSELLLYVSDYYDSQAEFIIKNLASLLEPLLIVILGAGVLFIALGIFLPMWNLMYLFKR